MKAIDILEAQTKLSQLVDRAAAGDDVIVSRDGKPLARITRLVDPKQRIRFGLLKGKVIIAPDFDATLPDAVLTGHAGR